MWLMDASTRRANFSRIIERRFAGLQAAAAAALGVTPGRITQLLDADEPFGERAARSVEHKLGMPRGALDTPADTPPGPPLDSTTTAPSSASAPLTVGQALPVVLDAIAACPEKAELERLLPLLATGATAYRRRLIELLAATPTPTPAADRLLAVPAKVESAELRPAPKPR